MDIVERFINYARIDTTSDPYSTTKPSTMKQFDLAKVLVEELKELGKGAQGKQDAKRVAGNCREKTTPSFCV